MKKSVFFANQEAKKYSDSISWDYRRLSGYSRYNIGDIMVFSHPFKKRRLFNLEQSKNGKSSDKLNVFV